jgi:hypothetical protein
MIFVWVVLGIFSYDLIFASDFVQDVSKIQTKIAENAFETSSSGEVAGEFIQSLIPYEKVDTTQTCVEEEPRSSTYEVVFVADVNSQSSSSLYLPSITYGDKFFAQDLLKFAAKSSLSENQLVHAMAKKINDYYETDDEKFSILAAFADSLYQNYNESRNPGSNNSINNPNNNPLPKGDMTLGEISKAAYEKNEFSGGVCNDISEAIALIGEKLFPDKDVLILNAGTHLGVLVSDGKKNRIIDGIGQIQLENTLKLNDRITSTNMRIGKMDNGKLKQIAVVDSETGLMMEKAFQTGRPLLRTSADVNAVLGHFGYSIHGKNTTHEMSGGLGVGDLTDGKMLVAIAKYENTSANWQNYIGLGGSIVDRSFLDPLYQIHLRAGTERTLIRYAHPQSFFKLSTGLQLEGMYGFKPSKNLPSPLDATVGIDFVTRAEAWHTPKESLKIDGAIEGRVVPGLTDWGSSTGAFSQGAASGMLGTVGNMNLQLNQIFATLGLETNLGDGVSLVTRSNYQGSHIGQALDASVGFDIKAKNGVQILLFTGYGTSKLPGFSTKESLLVGNNGAIIGAGLGAKSGFTLTSTLRDISFDSKPWFQTNLSFELEKREKNRTPSSNFLLDGNQKPLPKQ